MDYKGLVERLVFLSKCEKRTEYNDMNVGKELESAATAIAELLDRAGRAEKALGERWFSVEGDGLPKWKEQWERALVNVRRSHFPTSSYDFINEPYDEEFVMSAMYDSQQKIWHLDCGEQLNALLDIEDAPLNSDYVTHWMPLPEPPKT